MTDARLHRVRVATEEAGDGVGLRFGFDDHERFGHGGVLGAGDGIGRPVWSARATVGVSAPDSGVAGGPCQLRVVPGADGWAVYPAPSSSPALDHSRAQSGSEGDPQRPEPVRRDRADADHLRRDRPARRFLPPRRLAPLHRRDPRQPGQAEPRRHPHRVLRRRRHRRPGRVHHRPEDGTRACCAAPIRGSSNGSSSTAPRTSSTNTERRRSSSRASCRSCARSRRSSPASARCRAGRSSASTSSAGSSGRSV